MSYVERSAIRKTLDGDLVQLVGDYLACNSEKSYVNIEDMVDSIQARSFRFGRMKKQTFTAMVKRAYQRYLQMQTPLMPGDEFATPTSSGDATSSSSPPENATKANYSSDSDIEIVEDESASTSKKPRVEEPSPSPVKPATDSPKQSPAAEASVPSSVIKSTKEEDESNKRRGIKRKLEEDEPKKSVPKVASPLEGFQKRSKRQIAVTEVTNVSFEDFAGGEKVIEEVCQLMLHLKHPEIYKTIGVTPPRGFLLHGPPGCGKSLLANAIAGEMKFPMLKVAATELISGISGESESNIRDLFQQALDLAPCIIFLDEIDSITPKRETAQREMERRIVAQLLACIDELGAKEKGDSVVLIGATNRIETIDSALRRAGRFDREISIGIPDEKAREQILRVICKNLRLEENFDFGLLAKLTPGFVGADLQALAREAAIHAINELLKPVEPKPVAGKTEEPVTKNSQVPTGEKISPVNGVSRNDDDAAVGSTVNDKNGKSDDEIIAIDVEDSNSNMEIDSSAKSDTVDETATVVADNTRSNSLSLNAQNGTHTSTTTVSSWIRDVAPFKGSELDKIFIEMKHFKIALKYVQPSSKREGFATVPDTTWDDIGALKEVRDELQVSILGPVKYPEAFQALGISNPAGVLLCGPPGCGKTLLAKAVANEAGINFISVKGPELLNMYVGESERAVRQCFLRAKNSSPCVIFFDELDALCPRRSDGADGNSTSRVVNQLLTEMDGIDSRLGVYIMAATNRPDIIDPAVLRPGRLDKILFVNIPTPEDRKDILETITKKGTKPVLDEDVNMDEIAMDESCSCYTGADLAALVREASVAAFRELVLKPHLNQTPILPTDQLKVSKRHFESAFRKIKPSVSKRDLDKYAAMKEKYSVLSAQ